MKIPLSESYKIRYYYDRYSRSWVTQVLDEDNNEIDSDYAGNKDDRDFAINVFSKTYNTNDIAKW